MIDGSRSGAGAARSRPTILFVAGDCGGACAEALEAAGFEVLRSSSPGEALDLLGRSGADLVLIDLALQDAIGLCHGIKAGGGGHAPLVVASGEDGAELDALLAVLEGADDYLIRPYAPSELVVRLRAVLRRTSAPLGGPRLVTTVGPLELDRAAHRCTLRGRELALTPTEFELLGALMDGAGRALSRASLLREVWKLGEGVTSRTVDTHMKRLRDKLRPFDTLIATIRGVGYRLTAPDRLVPAVRNAAVAEPGPGRDARRGPPPELTDS